MISRLVLQWKYSEKEIFKGKKKVHLTHYILSELFLLHRDNKCFLKWEHFMLCISFVSCTCCCILTGGLGRRYCLNWKQIITEWKALCQRNRIIQNMRGKQKMTLLDIGKCVIKSYQSCFHIMRYKHTLKVTLLNHLHSHHIMIKLKTILLDRRLGQN